MVKGKKEPKLRFSEYRGTDGWEEVLFAEIFNSYTEKNVNEYPQYTIGVNGMKINNEGRHDTSKHIVFKPNSMMLGIGIEEVGFSKDTYGCCSPIYKIYDINDNIISLDFAMQYIKGVFNKNRGLIARTSTRREFEFAYSDLEELNILLPSLKEQQKIGEFFSLLDQKITLQQEKLTNLTLYKKGLLQQVMSREIRFKDSEGREYTEWEEVKLCTLYKKGKSGGTPKSTNKGYYGGNIPFLSISDITEQGKYITSTEKHITPEGLNNSSAWVVPKNSLVYSMYATVGLPCINKVEITTSQAMFNMVIEDEDLLEYLYYFLLSIRDTEIPKLTKTGTQANINAEIVKNLSISIPCKEEQHKIASLFSTIDKKIESEQQKLELLKEQKKGFMQQMFI